MSSRSSRSLSPTLQTQSQYSQVKRAKKRPSINTRASRVGVTNFINVIKNLHNGKSINYFPITEETLYEYIDSKKKSLIKSGSLEQYLQHIQAYNLALGFGWDGKIFGPIIKRALDELKEYEDDIMRSNKQPESSYTILPIPPTPEENSIVLDVCFDNKTVPSKILDVIAQVNLDNLKYTDPLLNLRKLYENVAAADLSKYWGGNIDDSQLFYRNCTKDSFVHYSLNNEEAFALFWTSFNERAFIPVLKSVTIRSPSRIYKKKIAITVNTTFSSLISFAIKKSLPSGKQFVIRAPDGIEYIPDDFVRTVITGVEHAEIILTIEDIGPIDFDCF
ncbi:350_t:CDS:2 [Diversispora eburnea]|uniref:350_t:CDS:1 n=1 Tax=Diversispora eburnea TaxID=1213867 RepID=A0A9N9B228_9GLOM|nr:350_t:CDS:2 [Diversispora eburnea]